MRLFGISTYNAILGQYATAPRGGPSQRYHIMQASLGGLQLEQRMLCGLKAKPRNSCPNLAHIEDDMRVRNSSMFNKATTLCHMNLGLEEEGVASYTTEVMQALAHRRSCFPSRTSSVPTKRLFIEGCIRFISG